MAEVQRQTVGTASAGYAVDEGLRSYMLRVYNYMAIGLAVTGVVAYLVYSFSVTTDQAQSVAQYKNIMLTEFGRLMFVSPLKWVLIFAPLALVFLFAARINSMSVSTAQAVFWLYAGLMGASIASIFLVYTSNSIAQVFFVTAAAFAGLSLWGYTTKKDLSGWGSFLIMGVIGIVIASVVNIFLKSSGLQFAVSAIGVLVFAGLTAYDTQNIKEQYYVGDDGAVSGRKAVMGALQLYLNFINMFMMMLSLFGNRE